MPATKRRPIFGIGHNKTATRAAAAALDTLGLSSRHNFQTNKAALSTLDFGAYDAYFDGPLREHIAELDQAFPNALFIFTTRDRGDWLTSRTIHVLKNRIYKNNPWRWINYDKWVAEWDELHEAVSAYFADRPEKLLVWNICDTPDPWPPICNFLGLPVPDVPFPSIGAGAQMLRACMVAMRARRPGGGRPASQDAPPPESVTAADAAPDPAAAASGEKSEA